MRYPTVHKFLAWAGPTTVIFVGACFGLLANYSQSYPGVRIWAENLFHQWWPIVTAPWFLVFGVLLICAYLWALVHTGSTPAKKPMKISQAALDEASRIAFEPLPPQTLSPSGLWLKKGIEDSIEKQSLDRKARWENERHLANLPQTAATRQRHLIAEGRYLVQRYRETQFAEPFGSFISKDRAYLDIQPHLGNAYHAEIFKRADNYNERKDTPARRDFNAGLFLGELARLEKEWNLV